MDLVVLGDEGTVYCAWSAMLREEKPTKNGAVTTMTLFYYLSILSYLIFASELIFL